MIKSSHLKILLNISNYNKSCLRNHHPFTFPNYNSYDLAEELFKNLIYNNHGIVVLNKPYGITFAEDCASRNVKDKGIVTIDTIKPFLVNKLRCKELLQIKVPERYASGVAIFCTDEKILKRAKKCLRSMRGCKQLAEVYDCVVIGQPIKEGKFEGGLTVKTSSDKKLKRVDLIKECSKNKVRKGIVKNVTFEHSTLSSSGYASRLLISATRPVRHSVRVYAARQLVSPILGDAIFGRYVKTVLGKQVPIDMFSPGALYQEKLPNEILSKLQLSSTNDIPIHIHLSSFQLKNIIGKNIDLEFSAQPPFYFLWTCEKLNLCGSVTEVDKQTVQI